MSLGVAVAVGHRRRVAVVQDAVGRLCKVQVQGRRAGPGRGGGVSILGAGSDISIGCGSCQWVPAFLLRLGLQVLLGSITTDAKKSYLISYKPSFK